MRREQRWRAATDLAHKELWATARDWTRSGHTYLASQTRGSQQPEICQVERVDAAHGTLARTAQQQRVINLGPAPSPVRHGFQGFQVIRLIKGHGFKVRQQVVGYDTRRLHG